MRSRFAIASFLLFQISKIAFGGNSVPISTAVCNVLANPQEFDGKIVRVNAVVIDRFEVFAIGDPHNDCPRIWLSYSGGMPAASLSINAKTPIINRPAVILMLQMKNRRKYFELKTDSGSRCLLMLPSNLKMLLPRDTIAKR
jgi:hypothetical protein